MILCNASPSGMMKAALLSELTGCLPAVRAAVEQPDLFAMTEDLDADSYQLTELTAKLAAKTGRRYDWLGQYRGRRLAVMILFCLRNKSRDCVPIIFAALAEALRFGPGHCILGRGRASAQFRRCSREVGTEIHRMLGLIRFTEAPNGDLVAKPKLFHHTADILLRKFQLRYPQQRLVFLLPEMALRCTDGIVTQLPLQDFPAAIWNTADDFAVLWETFYRSQYIPQRRNIKLAAHFVPKKYWDWLPEGKILEQEAKLCKKS